MYHQASVPLVLRKLFDNVCKDGEKRVFIKECTLLRSLIYRQASVLLVLEKLFDNVCKDDEKRVFIKVSWSTMCVIMRKILY
jgi:hypothetical protein